jgi:hypothetical protein
MPQLDPQQRLALLNHPDAQDCTVYRPDENDADAEERDLGDAKILFTGAFQPPQEWDAGQRDEFFGESAPELFMTATIECEAKPSSKAYFSAEIGDYVATMPGLGEVVMFYVHDCVESESGRSYVLIRDDESLD